MAITKDIRCFLVKDTCYIQNYARVGHAESGLLMRHGGIFAVNKNNIAEIGKVIKILLSKPLKIISDEEYMKELNSKEDLILNLTKTKSYGALAKISKDVAIEFMINDDKVNFTPYKKIDHKGNKERIEDKTMVANIDDEEALGQTLLQAFEMSE